MNPNNRNLFSIVAVLTSASIIMGISGIIFLAVDKIGSKPSSASNLLNSDLKRSLMSPAQAASDFMPNPTAKYI
jgi:hypothetical protein